MIFFELLLLPLLLVVEIDYVVVHGGDLFGLRLNNFFVILLYRVVVHLCVALVANSV